MKYLRFRHIERGEIIESDLVVMKNGEWDDDPRSRERCWSTVTGRRFTFALKLAIPAEVCAS